jgi:hypothetical protein
MTSIGGIAQGDRAQDDTGSRVLFIHEHKAAYPEITAYRDYLSGRFAVGEATPEAARADPRLGKAICWHMMGFYPKRLPARFVIHDYRSLSVGFARKTKDRIKGLANHRPDLRIFQNDDIRGAMGFDDGVPELFLPMGVPDNILEYRNRPAVEPIGDYCYIGSMLPERRIDTMIENFLKRYGATKSLWLFGKADDSLKSTFAAHQNVVFPGLVPQAELFGRLGGFGACVCYFPNHYPHILQTPTKLLEYAALGLRIIANEQPQSRIAERHYGINCLWGDAADMFADAPDTLDWPDNSMLDPSPMQWSAVIGGSGIDAALGAV